MAVAAVVTKQSRSQRLGIGLTNGSTGAPPSISSLHDGGLFVDSGLEVGMQVLSINNVPTHNMTSALATQLLKDAEGQVILVADNPVQAAVVAPATPVSNFADYAALPSAPQTQSVARGKKRGYIILKKTFKYKPSGFQMSTEKSYSFHGPMTPDMVAYVNDKLTKLRLSGGSNRLQFVLDQFGHYHGNMNHAAQKYHEEDFVVVILEAMEELGYYFRFQYDAESFSTKMTGDSYTAKELFIFHKTEE